MTTLKHAGMVILGILIALVGGVGLGCVAVLIEFSAR